MGIYLLQIALLLVPTLQYRLARGARVAHVTQVNVSQHVTEEKPGALAAALANGNGEVTDADAQANKLSLVLVDKTNPNADPQPGFMKLSGGHLSAYVGAPPSGCLPFVEVADGAVTGYTDVTGTGPQPVRMPAQCAFEGSTATASFQVCTIRLEGNAEITLGGVTNDCVMVLGCKGATCEQDMQSLKVCAPDEGGMLEALKNSVDTAALACGGADRIPSEIAHAAQSASLDLKSQSPTNDKTPVAFSPFTQQGRTIATALLAKCVESFSKPVIPHSAGKNSRSGAAFYFSQDRKFMLKRVRGMEVDTLWILVRDGTYAEHLGNGSTMNPLYLSYRTTNGGVTDYWVVMETAGLDSMVKETLSRFKSEQKFFWDVKPTPMVSDRKKTLFELSVESYESGLRFGDLEGWQAIKSRVAEDLKFLADREVIDHSLFVFGSWFDVFDTNSETKNMLAQIRTAMNTSQSCAFGCQATSADVASQLGIETSVAVAAVPGRVESMDMQLLDLSSSMGEDNNLEHEGAEYKCCCLELSVRQKLMKTDSPCVLISRQAPPRRWYRGRDGCRNLVDEGYHTYSAAKKLPYSNGQCLVNPNFAVGPKADERMRRLAPHILAPAKLGIQAPPARIARCAAVCVNIADYLLPFNPKNQFENALLVLYYQELKWTNWDQKVNRLLHCVGNPPPSRKGHKLCNDYMESAPPGAVFKDVVASLVAPVESL